MFRKLIIFIPLAAIVFFFTGMNQSVFLATTESSVAETLEQLGDTPLAHKPDMSIKGVSVKRGEELVLLGTTEKPGGGKVAKQSKNFVCTACHNIQPEDPDLRVSDPQARLLYAKENGMPFLQGTTLYGAVNRTSFYNGYYEKKYGDLVRPARNDLREAIQLCATQCSQGRLYEDWELESVLAYLWTLDLKLEDLKLDEQQYQTINNALKGDTDPNVAIEMIKSRYLPGSPATFAYPPDDRRAGYDKTGDAANGKLIYDLSCLYCHESGRFAFFNLDDSKNSFKYLEKHIPVYTRYSLYQVARWGTSPVPGKHTYMPNYTQERMSDQQMEDLRAYIEERAK